MAVDPNLSLQTVQANVAAPINQAATDDRNAALSAEQTLQAHYQNMNDREKMRLRSVVTGAAQLKTYLDRGDVEGAHDFLVQRQQRLQQRMANGEDIDDQETSYALEKLRSGDLQGLQNDVGAILTAGQAYNMIGGDGLPSSVREWQYYNSLSPEQKKEWLNNKRAGSNVDLGGSVIRLDAGGNPAATYDKTLAPADRPENAFAKSEAAAAGTAVGGSQGDAQAKLTVMQAQLPRLNQVVTKLSRLGKTATYTKAGVARDTVARELGAKVPQSAVARTSYISMVDNEVLPLLRQTFGAQFTAEEGIRLKNTLGDPDKSPEEKDAVLKAFIEQKMGEIQSLQRQVGQPTVQTPSGNRGGGAGNAAGGNSAGNSNMVKVSNGKETYLISPDDLPTAQAEGFQLVK